MKTFEELGVSEEIIRAITELGFENPMPVQEKVIPYLLGNNNDVIALAQTGTGKTAAYGLPVIQKADASSNKTQALILSPTRELCLQIAGDLKDFSKYIDGLKILPVYGGSSIESQIRMLKKGVQIIVATPGRLIDLMKRKVASLDQVVNVVLDEADEMLNMGFSESIDEILANVPEDHNTLLFSATMSKEIERIARKYLRTPEEIVVGSRNEGAEKVNHIYYMVHARDKFNALKRIVDYYPKIYGIIFCRTRAETQEIADKLIQNGYSADALHGDLSQQQRDLTMQKFRQHQIQLLVATDVAARGLDVDDLTHVINYGLPDDIESYVHRSGRTGRAGKAGTSIAIIHTREKGKIRAIEKEIGKDFVAGTIPSAEEICKKQLFKVIDQIEKVEVNEEEITPFLPDVYRTLDWLSKEDLIKRMVSLEFNKFLKYYANAPEVETVTSTRKERGERGEGRDRRGRRKESGPRQAEPGYSRLFINVGKTDGVYVRELMDLINKNVHGHVEVGRVDLMKNFSFFEVPEGDADRVIRYLSQSSIKGRKVNVELSDPNGAEDGGKRRERRGDSSRRRRGDEGRSDRKPRERKGKGKPKDTEKPAQQKMKADDWRQFFEKND